MKARGRRDACRVDRDPAGEAEGTFFDDAAWIDM